jgi:SepF-like predicted cell division protein (DUF552 family)
MRKLKFLGNRVDGDIEADDYVEVNVMDGTGAAAVSMGSVGIRIEKLNDFSDTEQILKAVRNGDIIFLKIKGLKEKDIGELKRAVERLKKSMSANNGEVVGIEQDWLVLTPEHAKVHR